MVSGPSGAGKGTLIAALCARVHRLAVAISATTRPRREGEREGVDYHFLDRDDFRARVASGDFLEHAEYAGQLYGTLNGEVDHRLAAGDSVVVEIEIQGARQVRAARSDAMSIFIRPPSTDTLARRLTERGTESREEVARRLRIARDELAEADHFDHVIVNDEIERAAAELIDLVVAGSSATRRGEAA